MFALTVRKSFPGGKFAPRVDALILAVSAGAFVVFAALTACSIARRFSWNSRISGRRVSAVRTSASTRSEEHTSELQSRLHLVCRLLLEKKKQMNNDGGESADTVLSRQNVARRMPQNLHGHPEGGADCRGPPLDTRAPFDIYRAAYC